MGGWATGVMALADTIEFDLTAVCAIIEKAVKPRLDRALCFTADVAISPSEQAALLAGYYRGIDGVVRPLKNRPAIVASEGN
jgi:hypothetical protein